MLKPTNAVFAWSWQGRAMPVAYDIIGEAAGPPILFLPAMSTVSTRAEMTPLAHRLADVGRPVLVDWPGFGDAPRAALDYRPEICRAFLEDFLDHLGGRLGNRQPAVVAAGHAAAYAYALDLEARRPGSWSRLGLVAPTWRGPLPTMMGGRRPLQARIRQLIHWPLIGPLIYRLNTMEPVVRRMYRGHVFADPAFLTPEFMRAKMRIVRQPNARFASASFVTGGLDPMHDRRALLDAAGVVSAPILMIYGASTPPRSRAEMEALGELPGVESHCLEGGALGLHEEAPDAVAARLRPFLRARSEAATG
jgi:pimeloyl-ACP methyl ester carboxylesterase